MTVEEILRNRREEIVRIAARHGATNVRVFGSAARGDSRPDSDIDLLVDAGPKTTPWFPAGLILDVEEATGCRVEVVTERGLNPLIRANVLKEAVAL
ncbi:MAG: nucleotidyltransferase family protein [Candidatus Hydrogenedentes bacterium]|nr:nucleotidyltransferase family protein [Candidatus Hydrogenedentota bacterium]